MYPSTAEAGVAFSSVCAIAANLSGGLIRASNVRLGHERPLVRSATKGVQASGCVDVDLEYLIARKVCQRRTRRLSSYSLVRSSS